MQDELFERELRNTSINGVTLADYVKENYQPSRKGHWIEVAEYSDGKHKIECSECGNYIFDRGHANSKNVKDKYKYCNYCGADMRGDTDAVN